MPDVANLGIQITADDRASKTLDDVEGRLRLTTRSVEGLSASTILHGGLIVGAFAAVGSAALKMAEQGVRAAADLEHAVANIATIKPDVDTSAVFKSLNNLQTQVPQTAKQLGDSLYDVFSSIDNITEEQGLKLVETFAKGATAAQTDAKTFGTAISGVLNAYKLDTSEATKVSDVFFNTVNRGVVTGPQLAAGLGPAIAAAKALGVSYEEAFALIVGATKEGGDAAQNINNITNLFSKLPTKEATADLNALGVATQTVTGVLRSPIAVLTDLKAKLDTMSEAARATALLQIFPDLQARQGAQVVMSQLAAVNTALAENRTATDSTAKAYETMSQTAIEQGKLLQNTWTALLTDLSVTALPALNAALGTAAGAVRGLRQEWQDLGTETATAKRLMGQATGAGGPVGGEAALAGGIAGGVAAGAQQAGVDWGTAFKAGVALALPPAAGYILLDEYLRRTGASGAAEEGKRVGADFAKNVAASLLATAPTAEAAFGGVAEALIAEFKGRGLNEDQAREAARLYMTAVGTELEAQRPGLTAKAAGLGDAVAAGLDAGRPAVIDASARIASEVGAALKANAGNIQAAIADLLKTESQLALGPARTASTGAQEQGVAQILERGNALKTVQSVLATLTPAEQAHYQVLLLAKGADDQVNQAETVLAAMRDRGTITTAQYAAATQSGARAQQTLTEAMERQRVAALGGYAAIQAREDALNREKTAALGGEGAIRARTEALEAEKVTELGGYAAMQQHDDERERAKTAALGGQGAIRARTESLEAERVAELGGYTAMQQHDDAREREKTLALGGQTAIRARTEALEAERVADLGGAQAVQQHEDALNREKTAALGGAVGVRAHTEALNEETIAALGGRAAILDHQAALQQLDKAAQQARTVFVDLADKMANYATSTVPAAVAQSLAYKNANEAANGALALLTGTQQAEVKALQNAGDAYGALNHALEEAHVGYQDVQGVLDGEWQAQERLSAAIQRNTQYRRENLQQALTAASNPALLAQQATIQQALANTGGGGAGGGTGSGGTVLSSGGGGSGGSPFASAEFAAWYQANYGSRETFINANATNPAAMATVTSLDSILDRFTNRFMDSYEANQAHERDKLVEALSHVGETLAQQAARLTGAPTPQANVDDLVTQLSRQALTTLERSMTLTQRANLEYTAQLQGPVTALQSLGRAINANVTEDQALAAATKQVTTTNEGVITDQGRLNQVLTEAHQKAFVLGEGMDFAGAAAARAGLAALEEAHNMQVAAMAAQEAAEQWKLAGANAAALMAGALRNAGVAGGVTQVGLTYTQIMSGSPGGGSSGGSNQGNVNLPPGNYYGLPVVSPVTGGSLRGFADGGLVAEPTYLTNARTGRTFGLMAEAGPERIGDGGTTITIQINANGVDALRDDSFWDQAVTRQIRPALKRVGVKV